MLKIPRTYIVLVSWLNMSLCVAGLVLVIRKHAPTGSGNNYTYSNLYFLHRTGRGEYSAKKIFIHILNTGEYGLVELQRYIEYNLLFG